MNYKMYAPSEALKEYVRYFWASDFTATAHTETVIASFADRFPQLIFQNLDGHTPITAGGGTQLAGTYLRGIVTKSPSYHISNSFSHLGISFYPHALKRLFKIDAHELTNEWPDLSCLAGKDLYERLQEASNTARRIRILCNFLTEKLDMSKTGDLLIRDLVHVCRLPDKTTVPDLLNRYRLSERQLERKFKTSIGVSPKTYLQLIRFEKAMKQLNGKNFIKLSNIAYDLGYSDQSHFIADFKRYAGFTPNRFLQQQKVGEEHSSFVINKFAGSNQATLSR